MRMKYSQGSFFGDPCASRQRKELKKGKIGRKGRNVSFDTTIGRTLFVRLRYSWLFISYRSAEMSLRFSYIRIQVVAPPLYRLALRPRNFLIPPRCHCEEYKRAIKEARPVTKRCAFTSLTSAITRRERPDFFTPIVALRFLATRGKIQDSVGQRRSANGKKKRRLASDTVAIRISVTRDAATCDSSIRTRAFSIRQRVANRNTCNVSSREILTIRTRFRFSG